MEKTLTIRDLRISFQASGGTVRAVRGVDLDLYQGETLAIVGESGSGKSVTVKAIMGIVSSNQIVEGGTILYRCREKDEWTERDLLRLSRREMRRHINGTHIAMVFQDPMTSLDPTMTIGMQLMEGMIQHLHLSKRWPAAGRSSCWSSSASRRQKSGCGTIPTSSPEACVSAWSSPLPSPAARTF